MAAIKVGSLNINGLQSSLSQLACFILQNQLQILCLQEIHNSDYDVIQRWASTHGFLYFQNSRANFNANYKQGTAFIVNKNLLNIADSNFESFQIIPNRIQSLSFELNSVKYLFVNVYLPSGFTSRPTQLRTNCIASLYEHLSELNPSKFYLLGDFNLVLSSQDCTGPFRMNTEDKIMLSKLIEDYNLVDIFRFRHPNKTSFTFFCHNAASRLDRIYVPDEDLQHISDTEMTLVSFSDHSKCPVINIHAHLSAAKRSTYWKLNDSLFNFSSNLVCLKTKFSLLLERKSPHEDIVSWWESFKLSIAHYLQFLSAWQNLLLKSKKANLLKQLDSLSSSRDFPQIMQLRQTLKTLQTNVYAGAVIRSRELLAPDDEDPSFSSLAVEQKKQKQQIINSISLESGSNTENFSQIRQTFHQYYVRLWNQAVTPSNLSLYLSDVSKINHDSDIFQPSPLITNQEVTTAINSLNKHAAPGSDGLTASLYVSLPALVPILTSVFNNAYLQKKLSNSQRQAFVKLLPKFSHPSSVKDWRPISLLNVDYKILATVIANRLKPLLQNYISDEQQCGLPNRHLFNNHLNIKSALQYANDISHPLAVVQIDFKKAFDSISHKFLISLAHHIGLPLSLTTWLENILTSIYSRLLINGQKTGATPITSGIRQGCPLSMLLFILGTEPLTQKINNDPFIRGLKLGKQQIKISQYADDVVLFLTDSESIFRVRSILTQFSSHSGLDMNPTKTKIMSNSPDLISTFKSVFPSATLCSTSKILGINFSFDHRVMKKNWKIMCDNIYRLCIQNTYRSVSIFGKVFIINSCILPRVLFLSRIIAPKGKRVNRITSCIFKFLWNNSNVESINRQILYRKPEDGGISFPCIRSKVDAALLWQMVHLMKHPSSTDFWIQYAKYNLSSKICTINKNLYSNSMPHRPQPNSTWSTILRIISKHSLACDQLTETTFKQLYLRLLDAPPLPLPALNSNTPPTS